MYLFYIDETGTPDINDKSPLFVLSAIAVQENQCRALMEEFFSIKDKYFPHLKKKRFSEIKANDILRPSRAKNRRNIRFVNDIAHMIIRRNLHVFSFVVYKKDLDKSPKSDWIYPLALQRLSVTMQKFLDKDRKQNGLLILNSRLQSVDFILARDHYHYLTKNAAGSKCKSLIELPLFSDSKLIVGLQLVDIVSFIVYGQMYQNNFVKKKTASGLNYAHIQRYWSTIVSKIHIETFPDSTKT